MKKRLVVILAGILLIVAVVALTSFISRSTTDDYSVFSRALNGETAATCTLTQANNNETPLDSTVYYFDSGALRMIENYTDTTESSDTWTTHTMVIDGDVYYWEEDSDTGTVHSLDGTLRSFLYDDIAEEGELRQLFEELEGTCRQGTSQDMHQLPDNIHFTNQLDDLIFDETF